MAATDDDQIGILRQRGFPDYSGNVPAYELYFGQFWLSGKMSPESRRSRAFEIFAEFLFSAVL
jgi:hypothetical protein